MADGAGLALLLYQFGRCRGQSVRPGERRLGFLAGEDLDRLIHGLDPLVGLYAGIVSRQHEVFSPEHAAELAQKAGIDARRGAGQVDLHHDLAGQIPIQGSGRGGQREKHADG